MCGIYGMVSLRGEPLRHPEILDQMEKSLQHRGPDGSGTLKRPHAALGATRLRIIDRRPGADQPFEGDTGDCWLVANGEIYNAPLLRARFHRHRYQSRSDVEPLLPLLTAAGPEGLTTVDGMFAVAAWNDRDRRLILARDRAGEKPLFYTAIEGEVWFASEVQALLLHPELQVAIDDSALVDYLTFGYVREPHTMIRGIHKVPAGTALEFGSGKCSPSTHTIPYPPVVPSRSPGAARRQLRALLENAVAKQLQADVPVGVFVSGGLDSSLLTALAAQFVEPGRIHTFTARFEQPSYDETACARRITARLGTRHLEVDAAEPALAEALRAATAGLAEPVADPAILPTYLLARAARDHVGVVLSGEGADELFGGYPTYLGHRLAAPWGRLPAPARDVVRAGLALTGARASQRAVPLPQLVERFLAHAGKEWITRHLCWFGTGLFDALDPALQASIRESLAPQFEGLDPVSGAMALDFNTYLRDALLVKLDRTSMLVSLETRAPYLDSQVTAFGMGLPLALKIRGLHTKLLLREVARELLPGWVVRRRKRGLSVPTAAWLNGGLLQEVNRLLEPGRLRRQGVLPDLPIEQLLAEHRGGRANHARALWALVVFQYFLEQWIPGAG
jgi:asparagine synthase (glutamine-hydrolysing)